MRYIIAFAFVIFTTDCFANADCKIVNGFNLCEDAKIIAKNESAQIGQKITGAEYVLRKVYPETMTVVYEYQSIYTKKDLLVRLGKQSMGSSKRQSTIFTCKVFKNDPFDKDGGNLVMKYFYKDGGHIHTNTINIINCQILY